MMASWEIADVIFNEGKAFMAETFNTTLMVLKVNRPLPIFTMEREKAYEKLFDRSDCLNRVHETSSSRCSRSSPRNLW